MINSFFELIWLKVYFYAFNVFKQLIYKIIPQKYVHAAFVLSSERSYEQMMKLI
jgi:hypothetical protein